LRKSIRLRSLSLFHFAVRCLKQMKSASLAGLYGNP
jgi:hypothetical protein